MLFTLPLRFFLWLCFALGWLCARARRLFGR
jgi:hypothetical protein